MKKIIFIILFFIVNNSLKSQCIIPKPIDYRPNTIYAVYQPVDFGFGIRYDRIIKNTYGIYGSFTHGSFTLENGGYIKHHYKIVTGTLLYLPSFQEDFDFYVGIGLSYNIHNGQYYVPSDFPEAALYKYSFELSLNTRVKNKINLGVRVDPIKWETSVDLGFSF